MHVQFVYNISMKSYKIMTYSELLSEKDRVIELLKTDKNSFTQKQNWKYLEKLKNKIKQYERECFNSQFLGNNL